MSDRDDDFIPHDFEEEARRGGGSPWNGLTPETRPARRSEDRGSWSPKPPGGKAPERPRGDRRRR